MKRLSGIITIFVMLLSGYIGYVTNYTNTSTASPPVVKYYPEPKPYGFDLNIDLNHGRVVANAQSDIKVNVTRKDSIIYKVIPKVIEKTKIVRVSEQPPVRKKNSVVRIPISQPNKIRVGVSNNTQRDV